MLTWKITLQGRVQGVGFRYFAIQTALRLKIKGTVRNQPDGSVEILAQGDPENLQEFRDTMKTGPKLSQVETLCSEETDTEPMTQFRMIGW